LIKVVEYVYLLSSNGLQLVSYNEDTPSCTSLHVLYQLALFSLNYHSIELMYTNVSLQLTLALNVLWTMLVESIFIFLLPDSTT